MATGLLRPTLLLLASFLQPGSCVNPLVNLTYSQYVGQSLANGITQWLGIRYATAPIGNLRFEPPQDPLFVPWPQAADKHGKICLGTGESPNNTATSEDCLFLDVYAPSNATAKCALPVFAFIQGGGFNSNSQANLNGTGLIMAGGNNMIVVTFNYRVGPYGFLTDSSSNGTIRANNGLRDQRKVLEWIQSNIHLFGGNPKHVVLGGASAGAASISLQMVAYGGVDYGLFHGAAASSVSFGTFLTAEQSAYQYENLAIRLGCASATANQTLSCLRSKSADELQTQNFNIPFSGAASPPLYMWAPVIDHDMFTDLTYRAFEQGRFVRIPMIVGDDTNGGTIFAPSNTSSQAQSNQFLKNQFPYITLSQLATLNQLYPNRNPDPYYPKRGSGNGSNGTWWRQLSNVYGEMRYMCPGLYINSALRKYGVNASWAYRWNVQDRAQMDAGLGVPHTAEVSAIFGPYDVPSPPEKAHHGPWSRKDAWRGHDGRMLMGVPRSYFPNETNGHAVTVVQGYWTSFIKLLDPNVERYRGSAEWKRWVGDGIGDGGYWDQKHFGWMDEVVVPERMLFDTGGRTGMERIEEGLRSRCEYLTKLGPLLHQ